MNCPACEKPLQIIRAGTFDVDVCQDGCGGTWFERFEIDHFDGRDSTPGEELEKQIRIQHPPKKKEKRICPKCLAVVMRRRFFSIRKEAEIDECGGCGGLWVDGGELGDIRKQFASAQERADATKKYYAEIFKNYVNQGSRKRF